MTVTFNRPLAEAEVLTLISRHAAKVNYAIGRAIEKGSGLRGTLFVAPNDRGGLLDEAKLEIVCPRDANDFKGFIEVVVSIPNKNLRALSSDELVFLADPSADERITYNPTKNHMPGVFWKLENFQLVTR